MCFGRTLLAVGIKYQYKTKQIFYKITLEIHKLLSRTTDSKSFMSVIGIISSFSFKATKILYSGNWFLDSFVGIADSCFVQVLIKTD